MDDLVLFSFSLSKDLPPSDRNHLKENIQFVAKLEQPTTRSFGPEWETFVAVVKDAGTISGSAVAIAQLANKIIEWRRNLRRKGIEPKARLQRPDRSPLDLSNCEESEIEKWLK